MLRSQPFFQAPLSPVLIRLTSIVLFSNRLLAHYYAGLTEDYGPSSVLKPSSSSSLLSLKSIYRHSSVLTPSSKQQQSPSGLLFWLKK